MEPYYQYDAEGSVLELGQYTRKSSGLIKDEYDKMFENSYHFLDVQTDQLLKDLNK